LHHGSRSHATAKARLTVAEDGRTVDAVVEVLTNVAYGVSLTQ
jgi:hypothetical protein